MQDTEENDDGPPAAKRSRLELINKSDNNDSLEIIMSSISALENLKKQSDVKEIIKSIERCRRFELPKSCRQRRTLNADGANDVSEAFSPPRITKMARTIGVHAGRALGLVETDPDENKLWDFF